MSLSKVFEFTLRVADEKVFDEEPVLTYPTSSVL